MKTFPLAKEFNLKLPDGWKRKENPNCFGSKWGELLYFYEDKVKYYEDLMYHQNVEIITLNINKVMKVVYRKFF
jgi:hypothetical protein